MPQFSIITPVYNPPREAFELCVRSVMAQTNPDWEWCLANDASPDSWVAQRLAELQTADPRIRVMTRSSNGGIVAASNDAIAMSSGEFLVLLDNDDELHREALQLVADALRANPECDYLYSDENKISPDGEHFDDFAKPTWSPERLLAQNYTSHLSVLRRSIVERVGRFRAGFDGSQDYDLVLRVIEQARAVVHVPRVLYHWRSLPTSTASAASAKPYAFIAALKAVREHLDRVGASAEVSEAGPSLARIRRTTRRHPAVTVIIPVDDAKQRIFGVETPLAGNIVRSLVEKTTYTNYTVTLVSSGALNGERLETLMAPFEGRAKVVSAQHSGLAQMLNVGLVDCDSQHAVLLDEHCEFIDGDWLETLLGYSARANVAAVAPLLLDEFGIIMSAGIGLTPSPHHIAAGRHPSDLGPVGMFAIAREVVGVSTHCALVDVAVLKSVGGFSPEYDTRAMDIDLACKLHRAGRHAIITPLVSVRSLDDPTLTDRETEALATRWGRVFGNDPYTRVDTRLRLPVSA
ncbi:MAG: glycosyltransferase [Actinomycetota bacterium]